MRLIEFKEVGMENYGPYIEPMMLTFQNDKMTLLTGPNGVGKTMALDAIPFTLYGVTSKKMKGDDVVNNIVGKNCKTWLKFNVGSDKYLITRFHKYTKFGNTVIINKNGVDTHKGQKEVLPEVEKLICSQKAFMNTLMFGQKVKDFFTDLVDSDKKEIFRKILNLEIYTLLYKLTDQKIKETKTIYDESITQVQIREGKLDYIKTQIKELRSAKENFYIQQKNQIQELKSSLMNNERLLMQWNKNLEEISSQDTDIDKIRKELSSIETTLKTSAEKSKLAFDHLDSQKQAKISELRAAASKASNEAQQIARKDLDEMTEKRSELKETLSNFLSEKQAEKHEIENEQMRVYSEKRAAEDRINEIVMGGIDSGAAICPTCEQEVTEEARDKMIQKKESYQQNASTLSKQEQECIDKAKEINKLVAKKSETINRMCDTITREIEIYKNDEKGELLKIEQRLEIAIDSVNKLSKLQKKEIIQKSNDEAKLLMVRQKELEREEKEITGRLDQITEIEQTISSIRTEILTITEQIKFKEKQEYDESQLNTALSQETEVLKSIDSYKVSIKETAEKLDILQFWKTGFSPSGIPSMLIDESIPFMNREIEKLLDKLSNGRYIVSFDTLSETKGGEFRDKISVRVVDTHTQANSRIQLSGGQTRLIDIATILTLGELQKTINDVTFNILLFDEIFDALDYDNVGYVCKVLNKIKQGKAIYIISHQHQEQLEADEQLTLN